ncbi:hypothetical protein SAMN05421809_0861 [Natronorubrum daqingense]|uniref:Uncharacterized protein n=1 Tax=Natronorubrum daqingense TaxID=588898 RepID=A0A1N6ZNN7_9EURY|nr:hypothetical protein SAMN05421809_0861 [Natronorubrum daqingense]
MVMFSQVTYTKKYSDFKSARTVESRNVEKRYAPG